MRDAGCDFSDLPLGLLFYRLATCFFTFPSKLHYNSDSSIKCENWLHVQVQFLLNSQCERIYRFLLIQFATYNNPCANA
jgi:hypothetical protein